MIDLLNKIKTELGLNELLIKHEIKKGDKDIDILLSESEFLAIDFPSNYKLIRPSAYNKHFIYIRFDANEQSFFKVDFIIDGLDYCNAVNIPLKKLKDSSRRIAENIFVIGNEYIYLDRYLGYLFFAWKEKRTSSYLNENVQPAAFLCRELGVGRDEIENAKILKSKLIRKKLFNYAAYHIKKKFFNLGQLNRKMVLVIMGIDGAGKTTLISELEKQLSDIFSVKTTYMGWHEFNLWPIKAYRYLKYGNKRSKDRKALTEPIKRTGFIENTAVFIELYSRYLKSRLNGKTEIIIFDRYFYDSLIRSKHRIVETLLIPFVPEPNLFILLDAPDNVLYSRKKEISMENIRSLKNLIYSRDYLKPIVIDTYENDISACIKLTNVYIFQNFKESTLKKRKTKGFLVIKNKYTVRNDAEAFSLFYLHFLFRPHFKMPLIRKIFSFSDTFFFRFLQLCYTLKINTLFPKRSLNENYLIKRIGGGSWPSTIELYKENDQYYIIKNYHDQVSFEKERNFLQEYFSNESPIKFPDYKIMGDKKIRYEFLQTRNLATQIRSGYFRFADLINLYDQICASLDILYKDQNVLIHGDLSPDNIYYYKNNMYIIDYADSHIFDRDYDKYILLKRLMIDYFGIEKDELVEKLAAFDTSKIECFKLHYEYLSAKKHTT